MAAVLPIRLAPTLRLPLDAVTETVAIMGVRGSGKSSTAKVLVEQLTNAGQQCVILDPTGVWWGLKSSVDGRSAGLPFTVLGGPHGDLPLSPAAGEVIADLVVETDTPLVLDLSLMRKAEQRRFVLAFAETLYHRNREPLMLVIDECDLFCPQRPMKGEERLLGAIEDIARRGRVKGVGLCAISQRPASVHKDVLSQASTLVAARLLSSHDRAAIEAWTDAHGTREQRNEMMATIASLATGEAWFWSPSWLDMFAKVQVDRSVTFDSMATPKAGSKRVMPKVLSTVDVAALRSKLAEFVAESEANDPKVLKRRIAELEREVAKRPAAARPSAPVIIDNIVEVPVVDQAAIAAAVQAAMTGQRDAAVAAVEQLRAGLDAAVERALAAISTAVTEITVEPTPVPPPSHVRVPVRQASRPSTPPAAGTPDPPRPRSPARTATSAATPSQSGLTPAGALSKAEATILNVLVQFPDGRTKVQLALLSGYSIKSSSLGNALGSLRTAGLVERGGNPIRATPAGVEAAGEVEPLPSGDELFGYWCSRLGRAEVAILTVMVDRHPSDVTKDELAAATGYSASSSSMGNALGRLRSLDMVSGWHANDDFVTAVGR